MVTQLEVAFVQSNVAKNDLFSFEIQIRQSSLKLSDFNEGIFLLIVYSQPFKSNIPEEVDFHIAQFHLGFELRGEVIDHALGEVILNPVIARQNNCASRE